MVPVLPSSSVPKHLLSFVITVKIQCCCGEYQIFITKYCLTFLLNKLQIYSITAFSWTQNTVSWTPLQVCAFTFFI
jgi:hypothetical protein